MADRYKPAIGDKLAYSRNYHERKPIEFRTLLVFQGVYANDVLRLYDPDGVILDMFIVYKRKIPGFRPSEYGTPHCEYYFPDVEED